MKLGWNWTWGWPLLGALSLACSAGSMVTLAARHDLETKTLQKVEGSLRRIMHREREYYTSNHAYAVSLEDLGIDARPPIGWRFRIIATTVRERPLVLVEAESGDKRLCIDRSGSVFQSDTAAALPVSAWQPLPPAIPPIPAQEAPHGSHP